MINPVALFILFLWFGVNRVELPPGAWSTQRHWHKYSDEVVVVISGELVMVTDEGLRTAPLGLSFFLGRNQADLTLLAAGAVIVATPVVVLYVFLQRHFIRGMVSGAVKG